MDFAASGLLWWCGSDWYCSPTVAWLMPKFFDSSVIGLSLCLQCSKIRAADSEVHV